MFSDHKGIKLKINKSKISGKSQNSWKVNNTVVGNQWVKGEPTREIRKHCIISGNEIATYQYMWNTVKSALRVHLEH